MSYVIEVDEGACAAHGDCAVVAPNVFRIETLPSSSARPRTTC